MNEKSNLKNPNIITIDSDENQNMLNNGIYGYLYRFLDLMNDSIIHEVLQKDIGVKTDYNDSWSNLNFFKRFNDYTLIKNDSKKTIFPYFANKEDKRLILPSSSFVIGFKYKGHENVFIRFVNLEGSLKDIDISTLNAKENDDITIKYENGNFTINVDNKKVQSIKFKLEEGKGYFSWKLPAKSYIKFSNFEIYTENTLVEKYFPDHNYYKKKYLDVQKELDDFKKQFKAYESKTNEILDSNNFLFNTLFLDYDLKSKNLLYITQKLCTELLLFVDNIAKENNIEWWLDYGNLLGSVRHDYFIPWDDDVDIGMMRNDYNQFNKIIKDEITNHGLDDILKVSYRKRNIDDGKVNSFLQIFDMHWTEYFGNTIFAGVDVFPYDFLSKYDEKNFDDRYYNAKLNLYRKFRDGSDFKSVYMGLDETALKGYYEELDLNMDSDQYIIPGVEGACGPHNLYKLNVLEKDDVFPLIEVPYGEATFYAPNNYDKHLRGIYGDYMKVPNVIRTHNRVGRFRYDQEAPKIFNNDFMRIKGVNEKF